MSCEADNYVAFSRRNENEAWGTVTLGGQLFFANKGLMADMLDAMRAKHPTVEFRMEAVK